MIFLLLVKNGGFTPMLFCHYNYDHYYCYLNKKEKKQKELFSNHTSYMVDSNEMMLYY